VLPKRKVVPLRAAAPRKGPQVRFEVEGVAHNHGDPPAPDAQAAAQDGCLTLIIAPAAAAACKRVALRASSAA
jgi:hypothetical protein